MSAFEDGTSVANANDRYCHGFINSKGDWKKGFFCPPKADDKNIYCCGTSNNKYCCDIRDENMYNKNLFTSAAVSSLTLFTAIVVTFILTVMMTVVTFICCRRFWKNRDRLEIEETHSYRLSSNDTFHHHPISSYEGLDVERLAISAGNCTSIDTYHLPLSSYIDAHNSLAFVEPPPPYHVNNPISNSVSNTSASDRLFAVIGAPLRRDVIYPSDGRQKRLWRTLSQ